MKRVSVKGAVQTALRADAKARKAIGDGATLSGATRDSFLNLTAKLGMGADNLMSGASYGFNPITRNRIQLEWIHRGSWLGGVAIDLVANDMTRAGIEYVTELPPDAAEKIDRRITTLAAWSRVNEVIKWSRLYGGALGVILIDGQDVRQPLNMDSIGPGQFRGILPLDRWMVEPSLEDLVTELGPHLGLPRYYRVGSNAPALRGLSVHHSRVAFRMCGIELPYSQALTEQLWGISVIERLFDRMVAFDSASTGAAQLVYKSYLRTLKVKGLREIVAGGGKALDGLAAYVDTMRRYQSIEGMTMLDLEDDFEVQGHQAFSGLSDALVQFGQQLSGALQIPLVRLFGQSPAGLNSTGESDLRMFYDHIKQEQQKHLHHGVTLMYRCAAASEGIALPKNFAIAFRSLWELSDGDKATNAKTVTEAVTSAQEAGLISPQVALRELRQSSRATGIFTNITEELIAAADDQVQPPVDPQAMQGLMGGEGGDDDDNRQVRPEGQAGKVPDGPRRRVRVQQQTPGSSKADQPTGQGDQS